jgi:hypothetical protein
MSTETQYKVFKELYEEEGKRYSELDGKAKLYITIITFYLGAIAFKFKDVMELTSSVTYTRWLYLAIGSVLIAALLCTVIAMRIRTFEGICNPEEVIQRFGPTPPSDDDFRDDRITDLAVATNRNSSQNDAIARTLSLASLFILFAGIIQFILFTLALWK